MNTENTYLVSGGAVGFLVGILLYPFLFGGQMPGHHGQQAVMNIDQHFIEQMIPHHEGAIVMAQVALQKSKRPEILSLATGIIEAQQREIDDMKAWYKEWYGKDTSACCGMGGGHAMHMDGMSGDMLRLTTTSNFDLEFIKQMIPHHEMAIMMAQMLAASTDREEMKTLADNIITSQSREIEMMRSWQNMWSK